MPENNEPKWEPSKVTPIRPIPGPLNELKKKLEDMSCPPHEPLSIHMDIAVQEPGKLMPTALRLQFCIKCRYVYWESLGVQVVPNPPKEIA